MNNMNDKWEIELSDNVRKIVTTKELLKMEKEAEEFDGFYDWRVVRKITETILNEKK